MYCIQYRITSVTLINFVRLLSFKVNKMTYVLFKPVTKNKIIISKSRDTRIYVLVIIILILIIIFRILKPTSEEVLQVFNRSHKHITDVLQVLNRSHKHIIDVLQVLNRSHKHITTSQPMRMYYKFLKNAVRNTSTLFCKSSTEVTNTSPKVDQ